MPEPRVILDGDYWRLADDEAERTFTRTVLQCLGCDAVTAPDCVECDCLEDGYAEYELVRILAPDGETMEKVEVPRA